ncbi:MAG: glucosylglycerol hydrolase, partial [Roseicyclus sp.]
MIVWAPELLERRVPEDDVFVEVLEPKDELSLTRARQSLRFRRTRVPVARIENYCVAAVSGMRAGSRDRIGSFYSLVWRD